MAAAGAGGAEGPSGGPGPWPVPLAPRRPRRRAAVPLGAAAWRRRPAEERAAPSGRSGRPFLCAAVLPLLRPDSEPGWGGRRAPERLSDPPVGRVRPLPRWKSVLAGSWGGGVRAVAGQAPQWAPKPRMSALGCRKWRWQLHILRGVVNPARQG